MLSYFYYILQLRPLYYSYLLYYGSALLYCCTVLYCTILFYTILYYTMLYYTIFTYMYTVLYNTIPYYTKAPAVLMMDIRASTLPRT